MSSGSEWLREQIAFAIFNDTNPPHVRDSITLANISGDPTLTSAIGGGYTATSNLGMDWRLNRDSFMELADVALVAILTEEPDAVVAERKACWNAVNALIKIGDLPEPAHSERNGMILAANVIFQRNH